jgi:hypothetical protein
LIFTIVSRVGVVAWRRAGAVEIAGVATGLRWWLIKSTSSGTAGVAVIGGDGGAVACCILT